jgi:hypothetical protein
MRVEEYSKQETSLSRQKSEQSVFFDPEDVGDIFFRKFRMIFIGLHGVILLRIELLQCYTNNY